MNQKIIKRLASCAILFRVALLKLAAEWYQAT